MRRFRAWPPFSVDHRVFRVSVVNFGVENSQAGHRSLTRTSTRASCPRSNYGYEVAGRTSPWRWAPPIYRALAKGFLMPWAKSVRAGRNAPLAATALVHNLDRG